MSQAMSSDID